MARKHDSQQDAGTPSRVYKSSDVHKRRVDRKGRIKQGPSSAQEPESPQGREALQERDRDAVQRENAFGEADMPQPSAGEAEAVVITPEFGRKTKAQRESDERWFAAMRNADGLAAPREGRSSLHAAELPEISNGEAPQGDLGQASENGEAGKTAESVQHAEASDRAASEAEPASGRASAALHLPEIDTGAGQSSEGHASDQTSEGQASAEAPQPEHAADSGQKSEPGLASAPESGDQTSAASFGAEATGAFSSRKPMSIKRRIVLVLTAIIVVAIAVATIAFTWNRWYRFDDRADIQGQWYVVGTTVPVTIDESSIHLTDDVTYQYEINPQDKTIRYTFGHMEGQGRYWFSDDRQNLVITDGDKFTSTGTAFEDLMQMFVDLSNRATGNETKLPEGEGIIAFSREPDKEALAKQEAEAEAKKKAEEDARKEAERKAAEEAAAAAAEAEYYEEYYEEEPPAEETPSDEGRQEDGPNEDGPKEEGSKEEGSEGE